MLNFAVRLSWHGHTYAHMLQTVTTSGPDLIKHVQAMQYIKCWQIISLMPLESVAMQSHTCSSAKAVL